MPLLDTNLVILDGSTDLTADNTPVAIELGPMKEPVWLMAEVPAGGAAMTLDIKVQINTTGSTYVTYISYPQITTAPAEPIFIPILLPSPYKDKAIKVLFDVGGTSPNFGKVYAGLVLKPHYDLG